MYFNPWYKSSTLRFNYNNYKQFKILKRLQFENNFIILIRVVKNKKILQNVVIIKVECENKQSRKLKMILKLLKIFFSCFLPNIFIFSNSIHINKTWNLLNANIIYKHSNIIVENK